MGQTSEQYQSVIQICREIFRKKTLDYGTTWRVARSSSLTDQIYIKANRIRTLQETGVNKVGDSIIGEFQAIVNYCVMGLVQMDESLKLALELEVETALKLYDEKIGTAFDLMVNKNHDYGEAWRDLRVTSITDLILMKLLRIKQIESHGGITLISEGIDSNYYDILNYAVFALIHLKNEQL